MPPFRDYSRRAIQPFIGLVLVACYVLVLLPLSKQAEELDKPLNKAWRTLATTVGHSNATSLDFEQIKNQLDETRQAGAALSAAEQKAIARLEPGSALRELMAGSFRLVDYQNELSQYGDELAQKARVRKIQIAPAVFDGFPQHRIDIPESERAFLWGALRMTEDTVDTAVACGASAIHALEVNFPFTSFPVSDEASRWIRVPVEIEFSAPASAATRVLQSLSPRHEELKPAGLPETSPEKAVMFIDRMVIKRQNPENTDEVRVWLRAVGFILRE